MAGRFEVEGHDQIDDETLTQSALLGMDPVMAVEGQVAEDDAIVGGHCSSILPESEALEHYLNPPRRNDTLSPFCIGGAPWSLG